MKYFQQLITEVQIDTDNAKNKHNGLKEHLEYLGELLKKKDEQILDEERRFKELLTTNINNYSHEDYLKHRQEELLSKATFLEHEIEDL